MAKRIEVLIIEKDSGLIHMSSNKTVSFAPKNVKEFEFMHSWLDTFIRICMATDDSLCLQIVADNYVPPTQLDLF